MEDTRYIVLIIYDISQDKQRLKVAKYLSSFGTRVQKSAFEANLNKSQLFRLITGLEQILKKEDNVRIYKLHSLEEIKIYGEGDYTSLEDVIII